MGWKNVKDHYGIRHNIEVTDNGICIGSDYIHDILVISTDGSRVTAKSDDWVRGELQVIKDKMTADIPLLQRLIAAPDKFDRSVPVYSVDKQAGIVIEDFCETPGWPNSTHSGQIMYENMFFTDRDAAVSCAKQSILLSIEAAEERVASARRDLTRAEGRLDMYTMALDKLEGDFPLIQAAHDKP